MLLRSVLLLAFSLVVVSACSETRPDAPIDETVRRSLGASGWARVIVNLKEPADVGLPASDGLLTMQSALTTMLGSGFVTIHKFQYVSALAGYLSSEKQDELQRHRYVASIQADTPTTGSLAQAVPLIGADRVRSIRGVTGKGVRVGVIDSGISTTHPVFKDAIVAQKCFTSGACAPNLTNESDIAEDDNGHGSNVSGIAVGRGGGGIGRGVAPGAEIVVVKALDRDGAGFNSDTVRALEFLFGKRAELKIRTINISIGSNALFRSAAACDASEPAMRSVVRMLNDAGVTIFASSGNNASATSMGQPGCITGVISVGAIYDASAGPIDFGSCTETRTVKAITCFTNIGGAQLDILAPGSVITSAFIGTGTSNFSGTSQASPMAAGTAALMLECNPNLKPAEILDILKSTGEPINDPRTGRTFPLIRAEAAVDRACALFVPGGPDAGAPDGGANDAVLDVVVQPDVAAQPDVQPDVVAPPAEVGLDVVAQPDVVAAPPDAQPDVVAQPDAAAPMDAPAPTDARQVLITIQCEVGPHSAGAPGSVALVGLGLMLSLLRLRRRNRHE